MASIVKKNKCFYVVYLYDTIHGERKQKWESFKTMEEARKRLVEVEYREQLGTLVIPNCQTLDELLKEYVEMYGKGIWSMSVYAGNTGLIKNYISPIIGSMKLSDITTRVLERYYQSLLKTLAVPKVSDRKGGGKKQFVTPSTIRKIHNLLRSCLHQAVKWDLLEKNPAIYATVPKNESKKRDIWDAQTLFHAMEVCEDERLKMAMNLSFAASLRVGELLGLTWDCVDISSESVQKGCPSLQINKELQRVSKAAMNTLEKRDVIRVFPETKATGTTVLVLKKPKTLTSIRKVFIPKTVAEMLMAWKREQDEVKEMLGDEYTDYGLVMANSFGGPTEQSRIKHSFTRLIAEHDLPPVVFHSLRHTSITYKLRLNGGDIKAVQGDSGHAQASMVTDQYSHILDDGRQRNAELIEKAFYQKEASEPDVVRREAAEEPSAGNEAELLQKVLANPELMKLLTALAQTMK